MSETVIYNTSSRLTGVLVASEIGLFLGKTTRTALVYWDDVFEILELISKVGELLVGSVLPAVGSGTRVAYGIDMVFLLLVMAD